MDLQTTIPFHEKMQLRLYALPVSLPENAKYEWFYNKLSFYCLNSGYTPATTTGTTTTDAKCSLSPSSTESSANQQDIIVNVDIPSLSVGSTETASVTLAIRDSSNNLLGQPVTKKITFVNNAALTTDNFDTQTIAVQRGNKAENLHLLFKSTSENISIPLDKCSLLTVNEGHLSTTSPYIYTPPTETGIISDTITCTIPSGTNIQGHVAATAFTTIIQVTITDASPKQITGIAFESTMSPVKSGETITIPKIKGTLYDGTSTTFTTFELSQCNDSIQSPSLGSVNKVTGIYTAPANITSSSTTVNIECVMSASSKKTDTTGSSYLVSTTAPAPATIAVMITNSCGDGIIETAKGEFCDDNNIASGDGCNNTCNVEPLWDCSRTKYLSGKIVSDCRTQLEVKCVGYPTTTDPNYIVSANGINNKNKNTFYSYKNTPTNFSDDECWALGTSTSILRQNCTETCFAINTDPNLKLSCNDVVAPQWNDCGVNDDCSTAIDNSTICKQFMAPATPSQVKPAGASYAPYFYSNRCYYRDTTSLSCLDTPVIGNQRICKCQ